MNTRLSPASPAIVAGPFTGGSARGAVAPVPSTEIPGGNARLVPKLEAIAAYMIANPTAGQRQIANEFKVSVSWIWSVTRSDAFRTLIATRAEEVYSSALRGVKEKMERVADLALERLEERLEIGQLETEVVLEVSKIMLDRIGHGSKKTLTVQGEVTHTHRADLINDTRAALLQRNRNARMRALGLLPEPAEEAEVIENGTAGELSAGRADRAGDEGTGAAGFLEAEAGSGGTGEGAAV